MLRYIALFLLVLLLALELKLWAGAGGVHEVWRLGQQVAEQTQENAVLKRRNEALSAEVEDLKSGKEAIEERARADLGLIKSGEIFYQVVEPASGEQKNSDGK